MHGAENSAMLTDILAGVVREGLPERVGLGWVF